MGIAQYFKTRYRADRESTFGIVAYVIALASSVAYLWNYLPLPATALFALTTAETADRVARWFGRGARWFGRE